MNQTSEGRISEVRGLTDANQVRRGRMLSEMQGEMVLGGV